MSSQKKINDFLKLLAHRIRAANYSKRLVDRGTFDKEKFPRDVYFMA